MKMSFKQVICLAVFSVLLYFLSLYGWVPQYSICLDVDEGISGIIILLVSIIEGVVFAFSLFQFFEFLMEKKKEKRRVITASLLMMIYIASMVLLVFLYENHLR